MTGCVALMYHVIGKANDSREARFCCEPSIFRSHLEMLRDSGWRVISANDMVAALRDRIPPPEKSVILTFDDGTACTLEAAAPIMCEFGYTASVFMVSGLIGSENRWMRAGGLPGRSMLSFSQLRELDAAGFDIGSHTVDHVKLAELPLEQCDFQLRASKASLEDVLGHPVRHFAFPYGSYDEERSNLVQRVGFDAAFTTRWGKINKNSNAYLLKRIEVMGNDSPTRLRMKMALGTNDIPPWSVLRQTVKNALRMSRRI